MTYIRTKEIPPGSGNFYDYEVESVREGGKVRQKHVRYLGKAGTYNRGVASNMALVPTAKAALPPARHQES